jgi:hypothetical protein
MDVLRTIVALALATACVPDVDLDESRLGSPRVLAVRGTPAEAEPDELVRYEALVAGSDGVVATAPLDWSYCVARTPLAELGPVARVCIDGLEGAIAPIGSGIAVEAAIPEDACRLFGPDPPPSEPGQPPGRPVDADATGGYYQPLCIAGPSEGALSLFEQRIACGVRGANQEQAAELARRYADNGAPEVAAFEIVVGGEARPIGDELEIPIGEPVVLRVRWPECPSEDTCGDAICGIDEDRTACPGDCTVRGTCGGAERYLRFDVASRSIVEERESIRVAWYTSAGTYAVERTGVAADDPVTESQNELTLDAPGPVQLVVVLRDVRGGAAWAHGSIVAVE